MTWALNAHTFPLYNCIERENTVWLCGFIYVHGDFHIDWPHLHVIPAVCKSDASLPGVIVRFIRVDCARYAKNHAFIFDEAENIATMAVYFCLLFLNHITLTSNISDAFSFSAGKSTATRLQCRRLYRFVEKIRTPHEWNNGWWAKIHLRYVGRKASQCTCRHITSQAFGIQVSKSHVNRSTEQ